MPLYSLAHMRDQKEKNRKRRMRVSDLEHTDSDIITLNHDGIHVETTLDETIIWDQIKMQIAGTMDCTNNPPFPQAHGGYTYVITAPGMFGTYEVEQGDMMLALSDTEESRDERYEKLWFHFSRSGGGGSMANIPVATNTTLGGILAGEDILVNSDGHVQVVDDSHNHTTATITGLDEILSGKANSTHTHRVADLTDFNEVLNNELSTFEESFRTPMTGASASVPGTIGMTPRPLAGDQNKFLRGDGTWAYPDVNTALGDLGVTATAAELNYSTGLTGNIQNQINDLYDNLELKANVSHTHQYAASASVGGPASSAEKVNHILHILTNGKNEVLFDGSAAATVDITPAGIGAAPTQHGNHVPNYSSANDNQVLMVVGGQLAWGAGGTSEDDPVQYSVFTGTDGSGDGSVGLVPGPMRSDAGKFLCASGTWEKVNASLSDMGVTTSTDELNYVKGVTSSIQTQLDGKAPTSHTHNYAASSTAGGNAIAAEKLVNSLGIKLGSNGQLTSFDGSSAQNVIVTPEAIGAAPTSHGNHVASYSDANNGQVYKVVNGTPQWAPETGNNLDGSATKDHLLVFSDNTGKYKDSGKTIATSMSSEPSSNVILTESGIAAYVESLLSQYARKNAVTMASYSVTSGGDMMSFTHGVTIKKITVRVTSDITASGFTITRGDTTVYTETNSNMMSGSIFEHPAYLHLDASVDPLHINFNDYEGGEATVYLEYAYDSYQNLETGESDLFMISKNLYNEAMILHSFLANGFIRTITINPTATYNSGITLTLKAGEYTMYNKEVTLTKDTPLQLDFYYPITATSESPVDLTLELSGYTEGSAKVYLEYADEVTTTSVISNLNATASQLNQDSDRLNEVLNSMTV